MKKMIICLCATICLFMACTKDTVVEETPLDLLETVVDQTEFILRDEVQEDALLSTLDQSGLLHDEASLDTRSTDPVFFNVAPVVGCPGQTVYLFAVKDWYLEPPIAVKLFSPTGNTYYVNMFRSGNYQYRFLRLLTHGRWYWRYVYALNKQPCQPQKPSYWKENTSVRFDGSTVQVAWPFDGQSCWVKTCGHGCNFHVAKYSEYYAQDWACTQGTQSKPFFSPLDGKVTTVGWSPNSYGNYVEIDQVLEDKVIRLRIAHLESVDVYEGQMLTAGMTLVGALGSTGNSSGAHAHCSVFVSDDGDDWENVAFEFVEECEEGWSATIISNKVGT